MSYSSLVHVQETVLARMVLTPLLGEQIFTCKTTSEQNYMYEVQFVCLLC